MEQWKNVVGFEGLYEVSNLGRIKNVVRITNNRCGKYYMGGKILKQSVYGKGYLHISLWKNKCRYTIPVHRIVAEAFIPNPNNFSQVNHINGIKTDNAVENLEWCNNSLNQKHAYKLGLQPSRKKRHL